MEILWISLVVAIILFLLYGFAENFFPVIKHYEIVSKKIKKETVFVLLSDLHACQIGRNNEKLWHMIQSVSPDFICIAGDMTVKNGTHTERVLAFLTKLSGEYPVYYAPGNHEIRMPEYEAYKETVKKAGVCYLENNSTVTSDNIRITGLDLPEYWYHKCWQKRIFTTEEMTELIGRNEKQAFSLLLAHNPEYFEQYADWGADLVLSGHIHGGIARLPFLGGVISPSLRLFPRYDAGEFERTGSRMVISRGLGLHHIRLRFFNRPEVSVIKLSCLLKEK
ncbi:MAG: metallophosphoesterase [Lachnospiraceae bacterium]|nr:metallophosphoesterase [Lachnospiraceae bacterium]